MSNNNDLTPDILSRNLSHHLSDNQSVDSANERFNDPSYASSSTVWQYRNGKWETYPACPPAEILLRIIVNGKDLISIVCSPEKLDCLALGFLHNEGIIHTLEEVRSVDVDTENVCVRVLLAKETYPVPQKLILTPGFGGGIIFSDEGNANTPISDFTISGEKVCVLMEKMKKNALLYKQCGGIHASAVCEGDCILIQAEDIGRHNTMDKVLGEALLKGISVQGKLMLTTGRISSEMVHKASKMAIPAIASLSSPTSKAVKIAENTGIALAGYVQRDQFIAYANHQRFINAFTE